MRNLHLPIALLIVLGASHGALAEQECPAHVVRAGDTLSSISLQYGGDPNLTGPLYAANRDVIGANPDYISPGLSLTIPCAEGGQTSDAAPTVVPPVTQALPAVIPEIPRAEPSLSRPLQILTGGPFPPFVGTGPSDDGMASALILAALERNTDPPKVEVFYVNDRAKHLDLVMPRGGFDLAFPWPFPDCTSSRLGRDEEFICETYLASDPFYEYVVEYYTRADNRLAAAVFGADLKGASLCLPSGVAVSGLEYLGLVPGDVRLVSGTSPADCLRRLDEGTVDVTSMDAATARTLINTLPVANPMVVLDNFTMIQTLHALALKDAPDAARNLDMLNQGLARIVEEGDWLRIIRAHQTGG